MKHAPSTVPSPKKRGNGPLGLDAPSTAVFTLLMAALGLGALKAVLMAVPNLNLRRPVSELAAPPADEPATGKGRVLFVVTDGLRMDTAWEQPFLGELRARGAVAELWVDPPSYSSAQYVSFLTGVPPVDSGVRTNVNLPRVLLDNIPRQVRATGRMAIQLGDEVDWWRTLFGDDFDSTRLVSPRAIVDEARTAMPAADFVLIHLCAVDEAGHKHGARSKQYAAAAADVDARLREIALAWGWPENSLVVVSDHGHMPDGGHGGEERDVRQAWMIGSGPGFVAGAHVASARPVDVAPTLAALLGVPAPANAHGRTLVELLTVDAAVAERLVDADTRRQEVALSAATAGRKLHLSREASARLVRGVATLICVVLLALVLRRLGRPARLGLLIGAATMLTSAATYWAVFGRLSFSADRDASNLAFTTLIFATGLTALALLLPFIAVARRALKGADTCALSLGIVAGAAPLAVLAFVWAGAFNERIECRPAWLAAGPLIAYCLFAPTALAASFLAGLASALDLIRSKRDGAR